MTVPAVAIPNMANKESEPQREPEPANPYVRAARYLSDKPAYAAYTQAQDLLFSSDADLSAYRIRFKDIPHVVVLGSHPPPNIDQKLAAILKDGQPTALPPDIVGYLVRRQADARRIGPWVEGHYRPGLPVQHPRDGLL